MPAIRPSRYRFGIKLLLAALRRPRPPRLLRMRNGYDTAVNQRASGGEFPSGFLNQGRIVIVKIRLVNRLPAADFCRRRVLPLARIGV